MESRELTFGEKLAGVTFNPSGDDKVAKAKQLCAELADILFDDYDETERTGIKTTLFHHAVGEIVNAQMTVVKVLTLKY
jgi:hypothetical protein